MRLSTRNRPYICLPCQLRAGRLYGATTCSPPNESHRRARFSSVRPLSDDYASTKHERRLAQEISAPFSSGFTQTLQAARDQQDDAHHAIPDDTASKPRPPDERIAQFSGFTYIKSRRDTSTSRSRSYATSTPLTSSTIELSKSQQQELNVLAALRQRLTDGLNSVPEIKKDRSIVDGMLIDDILKALPKDGHSSIQQKFLTRLGSEYTGRTFNHVKDDIDLAGRHRTGRPPTVSDSRAKEVLVRLGVVDGPPNTPQQEASLHTDVSINAVTSAGIGKRRQSLANMVLSPDTAPPRKSTRPPRAESRPPIFTSRTATSIKKQTVGGKDLLMTPIEEKPTTDLPQLSFDLSRVLFNPGVYQLRDPRSRVYNFDPYLEHLMPVSQFKFDALNPYLTSSEDRTLSDLARDHGKRYVGSSSSMTSILSHFHFLLSSWRPLSFENFTRGFGDMAPTFTVISRAPAAIFLRYQDGIYAVDADKEYDEPNVLMSFGHMMEKLLTLEKDDFEKWRRTKDAAGSEPPLPPSEAFHYSQQGRFLLRSQLDAHDPRLPGTGYFDLKTRAVAGIRMNIREHETGLGYQIKDRFGTWESYEREYYDMARSTFLKYSLQARMGSMDGIFVAYHNISRTFGFQYVPLSEMDTILHGQSDPCLGDQEYRFSVNLLEEVFNTATEKYPNTSLRIHFETREAIVTEPKPYMNIFIEPMTEEGIKVIQSSQKAQFESFERSVLRGEDPGPVVDVEESVGDETQEPDAERRDASGDIERDSPLPVNNVFSRPTGPASSAANKEFLNSILNTEAARTKPKMDDREVMCLKLTIQTKVNERPYNAPSGISSAANWTIDYNLERRSDEQAAKLYKQCRSKRMAAVKTVMNRGSDDYFIRSIRQMSEKGAEWRKEQDELDAQREQVVLYGNRQSK